MDRWVNNSFGNAGRFYPFVYLAPIPILGVAIFLFAFSFTDGFQQWESIVIAGFGVFFLIYFFKAVDAIKVTRSAIKEISIKDRVFLIKTFGGKVFEVNDFIEVRYGDDFFKKKHIQFMFPENAKNTIIRCGVGEYYISGNINGIDDLLCELEKGKREVEVPPIKRTI